MRLTLGLLLHASSLAAADALPIKTLESRTYGFALDYPADFRVKQSKGEKGRALWIVSFYADAADAWPCLTVEAQPLTAATVLIKTLGTYAYDPAKNEWRLAPGYDTESAARLSIAYLTPAKLAAYISRNSMSNAYRNDTLLTDKGYALTLRHSNASKRRDVVALNEKIVSSLRLIGTRAIEAKIVDPPPGR